MGAQFGIWYFDGRPIAEEYVDRASSALAPYGPDTNEKYSKEGTTILYRAFHTTKESHFEAQPHASCYGDMITWDGRLDNRNQLISQLKGRLTIEATDVDIVAAAYEEWGEKCFAKLLGDWALSIWKAKQRSLLLAKDPVGTRHLYYLIEQDHVTWSTVLDPLVLLPKKPIEICEEYVAGWLSYFPSARLTPYLGILAVEPSSFIVLQLRAAGLQQTTTHYWDFNPNNRIRYRTDSEYEEQFLSLFVKAVERRLRSDRPILCELSGGIDSSSIVCVADNILARGKSECPRVDTISWFDDTYDKVEPDTNELHWIVKVEEKRSREGYHLDYGALKAQAAAASAPLTAELGRKQFLPTPEPIGQDAAFLKHYAAALGVEHRVTLSGVGGSEFTGGGVPTPVLELQNLISRGHVVKFARQLEAWSLKTRERRPHVLWRVVQGFLALRFTKPSNDATAMPWLHLDFVHRNGFALQGYAVRTRVCAPLPSFQDCVSTLNAMRRLLASCRLRPDLLRESRFPYLDIELLEFLFAIPREQIVTVGRRRHLVRRAFKHIVPEEIIYRRRRPSLSDETRNSDSIQIVNGFGQLGFIAINSLGIVDWGRLQHALQQLKRGEQMYVDALHKTLSLELWLQRLASCGVLRTTSSLSEEVHGCEAQIRCQGPASVSPEAKQPSSPICNEISAG